ncbi:MAG: tetratricopeptide repeat protein [Bacteroidales bacterium]|jgi:tetratricopeptide (TPR) repeat protein|nr:tetratricopeptide repeat protein [Bacteroidales bacterium]
MLNFCIFGRFTEIATKTLSSAMIEKQPLIKKYAVILIAIVGILAYANSFNNSFQFDDGFHIIDGQKIKKMENVTRLSHWKAVGNRPLSFFTLAVDYKLADKDPSGRPAVQGFHVSNLIFHILAGFMAFLLALEIMSLNIFRNNKIIQDYKVLIALSAGFIFVAHPIQTQSVTYIVQRMAVLAGLFYLWSIVLYIRGRRTHLDPSNKKAWKPYAFYAGAFLAGFFGFLSKQNAITFPIAFLLVEFFFIRDKEMRIDKKFLIAASSIIGIIIVFGLIINGLPREFDRISRSDYLVTQFRVLVKYWQLLILPINQHLDYYWPVSQSLWGVKELVSLGVLLLTVALGVWLFMKKWYIASFGIFWFYLTLSLESSIIPIRDLIFEHRLYLATFGFGFVISYLAFYFLAPKNIKYPIIILSVLALAYIGASLNRNSVWKNPYTLWSDSIKKSPKRERAHYWLATYYMEVKDNEKAMESYNTSIECNPGFPLAYNGRANLKKELGKNKEAIEDYNKAIKLDPNYITAYYNRGITYAAMNKLDKAIQDYDKSIRMGNNASSVYYNRANAKRRNKDMKGALEDYNISIKIDPNFPLCFFNRGLTRAQMGDHVEAIKDIDRAIKMDPRNHLFYNGKGVSQISLQQYKEAIGNFDKCIQLNPNFGQAYYNRGYAKQKGFNDKDGACKDWEISVAKGYKAARSYIQQYCK